MLMYASLCNVFFGYKHFQFLSNVSLHLSDSIAVPVHYTLIGQRRVQYYIYFVEVEILVEAVGRDQYFQPRQNKCNIGQYADQVSVLLYPYSIPLNNYS